MFREEICNDRFIGLAGLLASWSEDCDIHVRAVIVGGNHEIRATGYNGLPHGISDQDDRRFDRVSGEKFYWAEHAEPNAINNAARIGTPLAGCTIYVNRYPCADCARAIIQTGISKLVCPPGPELDGALDQSDLLP